MKRKERGLVSLILALVLVFNMIIFDCYLAVDTAYASEPDTTPPAEVTNLRGQDIGYDYIKIAWDAAADDSGTVSYAVYKDDSGLINTDLLFYQDNDLDSGASFEYGIKSIDPSGNALNTVSITMPYLYDSRTSIVYKTNYIKLYNYLDKSLTVLFK